MLSKPPLQARIWTERVVRELLMADGLREYHLVNGMGFASSYIKCGPRSADFLRGNERLMMTDTVE